MSYAQQINDWKTKWQAGILNSWDKKIVWYEYLRRWNLFLRLAGKIIGIMIEEWFNNGFCLCNDWFGDYKNNWHND